MKNFLIKIKLFSRAIILFSLIIINLNITAQSFGLRFIGQEHEINKCTSLELFDGSTFITSNIIKIEFDLLFEEGYDNYFGYVFRMLIDDSVNLDLVSDFYGLNLIVSDYELNMLIPIDSFKLWQWNHVTVEINSLFNSCLLQVGKHKIEKKVDISYANTKAKIFFGVNHEKKISTTDCPNMSIRDIMLFNDGTCTYHWPLNEASGFTCVDIISKQKAAVENPHWLYQEHYNWKLIHDIKVEGVANFTYSPNQNKFYIVGSDSILVFSPSLQQYPKWKIFEKPVQIRNGQHIIYNDIYNSILLYSIDFKKVLQYNISTNKWDENFPENQDFTHFFHHNKYISPIDSSLNIFNGYGFLLYKNDVHKVQLNGKNWVSSKPDKKSIEPRYLAGLGVNSTYDTVYIFGGYGSKSGDQKNSPGHYNNLIQYIPSTGEFKTLFSYDDLNIPGTCSSNSLVLHGNNFFALLYSKFDYQNSLQLYQGSLKTKSLVPLGNNIPFLFHDIETYVDLFVSSDKNNLYAVILNYKNKSHSEIKIYSLKFPPVSSPIENQIIKKGGTLKLLLFLILFIVIIGASLGLYVFNKKKPINLLKYYKLLFPSKKIIKKTDVPREKKEIPLCTEKSIMLFPNFQVYDRSGNDITGKFTPLLKEMFLLLLLNSLGNGKGITSDYMTEILWADKDEKQARNNRAVNLRRIKEILSSISDIDLNKDTGCWKLYINTDDVFIDYALIKELVSKKSLTEEEIIKIVEITKNSSFLEKTNYEWLDPFKGEITNAIIDTLLKWARENENHDPFLLLNIADVVLKSDTIEEEAVLIKCNALVRIGKHSLAIKTFDLFTEEYKKMYGEKFKLKYKDFIK